MEWADSLTGFLFTRYDGYYLKTIDGGESWHLDSLGLERIHRGFEVSSVDFKSRNLGIATYAAWRRDTLLYVTEDGGVNWTQRHLTTRGNKYAYSLWGEPAILRMDNKGHLYYLFSTEGMPVVCHIHRSTDLGETWTECGRYEISDFSREMIPMDYLVIDSLTQYTFTTLTDAGDYWWSYAKLTVDGGQTWKTITDSGHPFGAANLSNIVIDGVDLLNDTSFSVRLLRESASPKS